MQTFLPYKDFRKALETLDDKRLGKQRVEAKQVIDSILLRPKKDGSKRKGYLNHSINNLWRDYIPALQLYYNLSLELWAERGFQNIILKPESVDGEVVMPPWLTDEFCDKHKQLLLEKKPDFYKDKF